jgi:hypothetical protein
MRRPANLEATSQLPLGAQGIFEGEPFVLSGRRCIQGVRGQIWNEWTLRFEHDRPPLFLAESWGSLTLFREGSLMPALDPMFVGMKLTLPWILVERGAATRLAKWGDLDEAPEVYRYFDFSYRGEPEKRASIAEDETFIGTPTDAASLGLTLLATPPVLIPTANVSMPAGIEQWLEVGDVGSLEGVEYRVLGLAARRTVVDSESEPRRWQDYFLYNARVGFRWLSVADGHWTYAVPIEVGPSGYDFEALAADEESTVRATLEWATGELPWSADIGEHVMVSERGDVVFENSLFDLSASRIHELTPDAVAKAFGKRSLPRPK